MKDKKIIILSIVGVLLLVSIVIATSYAYFVANVSGNKDTNNVVVTNGVMALEYKDGDAINLDNAIPGSSVSKTFTVKNTGNVSTNYTIYFSELSNKFVDKTDLVYTLTSSDGGKNVAQTQVPSTNDAMVSNYAIDAGKTHTYTLTITFLNKDENQDDNQNVSFSTKVAINESFEYKEPRNADQIVELAAKDTANFATDDQDNNIRYIGANPNNYIYFNCSDYSNQSDSTCEKWRIIGVFKNMTKEDGSKEDLVKIIKDDRLNNTNIIWDGKQSGIGTSATTFGSNDWTDSQLMMMLNPTDYLKLGYKIDNNIVKDSKGQAIYQNMGSYYNGASGCKPAGGYNFECYSIDFTSTGLKNGSTRNAIESVVWNLGGTADGDYQSSSYGLASHFYGYERGTSVYSGHATNWTGKIGLMYPSDYGYATSGGSTTDRATCLAKEMYNWDESDVSDCKNNDYLYNSSYSQWTLVPCSSNSYNAFYVSKGGFVSNNYAVDGNHFVRPAAFLKSNILLSGVGDGSSNSPYQLKVG